MTSWQDLVEPIKADRERGASQLYLAFLRKLQQYTKSVDSFAFEIADLPDRVAAVRPEMAPFHYLARKIAELPRTTDSSQYRESLRELLEQLEADAKSANRRLSPVLKTTISGYRAIMLHSYSGTLRETVAQAVSRDVRILISEANPGKEGLRLAEELRNEGFVVVTYRDEDAPGRVESVDAVVVGADWIAEEYFVNKIGTRGIAEEANKHAVPFYVLSDRTKLVSSQHRDSVPEAGAAELFEETPSNLVTKFLLPDRGYTFRELRQLF